MSTRSLIPWLGLVGVVWLQSINGTNSDFSAYSPLVKERLGITQVQLNNLAVASDAGKLLGWLSGVASNHLPLWMVLLIGALIGLIGYGVQYLFLADVIPPLSYWQAVLLSVLAGNSICWINTVCYVISMRNFPSDHGTVLGLTTSYSGLSAKVYMEIKEAIVGKSHHRDGTTIYLLLNGVVPLGVGLIVAPIVKHPMPIGAATGKNACFVTLFVIASVTGAYALVQTMVPTLGNVSPRLRAMVLLLLIISPVVVFILKAGESLNKDNSSSSSGSTGVVMEEVEIGVIEYGERLVVGKGDETQVEVEQGGGSSTVVVVGGEHGLKELALSVDFWLYFLVYTCGATLGMVYLNNLGQISQSRGVSEASALLSISSSFGFFGKLFSAVLDACTRSRTMVISRPTLMVVLMVPMAASFFLLLNSSNAYLFISTAILGTCTGAITSIAVSMTSELFGSGNFGVNHNIVIANIPIGSFLFGSFAAFVYDQEGGDPRRHGPCLGLKCYRTTFTLWGSVCSFGTILSFVLYCRTRKCCSQRL